MTQAVNLAKLGSSGGPTIDSSGNITTTGVVSMASSFMRNRIINGDMRIWQRGTTFTTTGLYGADRWKMQLVGTTTISQETSVVPTGSQYALKWITGASSSYGQIRQFIETVNLYDLRGQTVTASAQVRCNATFSGNLQFEIGYATTGDASTESYTVISGTSTGTVNSSGYTTITWTGTIPSNALGLYVGVVPSVVQASGAIAYIGNVQLEVGSTATPFERRLYGQELALCQRYYEILYTILCAYGNGSNGVYASVPMKVSKRATPTGVVVSTDSEVNVVGSVTLSSGGTTDRNPHTIMLTYTGAPSTGFTRAGANITLSAEL